MKILVTGGAGFIGHHLVKRLTINGENTVYVLDDLSGVGASARFGDLEAYPHVLRVGKSVGMFNGDDYSDRFDLIYHLAAVSRTVPAITNPVRCMYVNTMGTVEVLELARLTKCPRVVVSSSNVVYAANTPYKASKLAMEEACRAYHETYGLSVICLRYSNVYGPGFAKGDPACLAAMRDSLMTNGYLTITGDGKQTRDFTHVQDIVEGNLAAAKVDYCGTVDLCTGVNWSMNRAADELTMWWTGLDEFNPSECIRHIEDRHGDIKHIAQDPGPAKEILGWEYTKKFNEHVKDVWTL